MYFNQAGPPANAAYLQERRIETRMTKQRIAELGTIASSSSAELSKRIAAVVELGSGGDVSAISLLTAILARNVEVSVPSKNWDPVAAQRIVELHAIAALHRLGDDSGLSRIPELVGAGGRVLQGPDDERRNATKAITGMGSVSVIRDLIAALQNVNATATANVIEVLDTLHLPEAPVRQDLGKVPAATATVSGVSESLRDLLQLVFSAANGSVRISQGVERMIAAGASTVGRSEHDEAEIAWLLERFFPSIGLDYYVEGEHAVICTFAESAERWRDWWARHGARLDYVRDHQTFGLRAP